MPMMALRASSIKSPSHMLGRVRLSRTCAREKDAPDMQKERSVRCRQCKLSMPRGSRGRRVEVWGRRCGAGRSGGVVDKSVVVRNFPRGLVRLSSAGATVGLS